MGNVGGRSGNVGGGSNTGSSSSPILAIATTGNVRTQASYAPAAQGVSAMTSDLDLVITAPTGTTKVKLDWKIYGQNNGVMGFVVYKSISGGAYSLLAMSRDGSANYWSVITGTVEAPAQATTTSISVIDTSPSVGSSVTYRLYVAEVRNDGAGDFYLNRYRSSTGAAYYPSGSSTGEAKCI